MIEINGYPVFGKDSSPHITSAFLGLIGTFVFFIFFILAVIFVKPAEKYKKYKEVQIVLDTAFVPVPVEKKADEKKPVEKTVEQPVKQTMEKPVEQPIKQNVKDAEEKNVEKTIKQPVEKPAKQPVKKTEKQQTEKSVKQPIQHEVQEYALDPMEAFAQQTAKTPKKDFDWDSGFGDSGTVNSSSGSNTKVSSSGNSFSGSAGTTADTDSQRTTSSEIKNNSVKNNVSENTGAAIKDIRNTKYISSEVGGVASQTTVKSGKSSDGKVFIEMTNGEPRALLKPESPKIILSEEAASLIDSSRSVTINFRVLRDGNVSEISITPAASLPQLVKKEIKDQLGQWIFESADYDATAKFEYNIVKK